MSVIEEGKLIREVYDNFLEVREYMTAIHKSYFRDKVEDLKKAHSMEKALVSKLIEVSYLPPDGILTFYVSKDKIVGYLKGKGYKVFPYNEHNDTKELLFEYVANDSLPTQIFAGKYIYSVDLHLSDLTVTVNNRKGKEMFSLRRPAEDITTFAEIAGMVEVFNLKEKGL